MQSSSTDAATTRPTTIKRVSNHCWVHSTRHSKWLLYSAMRGGLTTFDGSAVSPAFSNSLTHAGNGRPSVLTFSKILRSKQGMLTTNSLVANTFRQVSLGESTHNAVQVGSGCTLRQVAKDDAFARFCVSTVVS